jgi:hypothetical protein
MSNSWSTIRTLALLGPTCVTPQRCGKPLRALESGIRQCAFFVELVLGDGAFLAVIGRVGHLRGGGGEEGSHLDRICSESEKFGDQSLPELDSCL